MKDTHRIFLLLFAALVVVLATGCSVQQEDATEAQLDEVTLQLQWITQAQFAGYYVALDNGWYLEEGIDLTIAPGGPDIIPADALRSGTVEFGTGLLADIIVAVEGGNPLVSVAQIQQSNGLVLLAKKDSGIAMPQDFLGKRVGVWMGGWQAQFDALVAKEGVDPQEFELVSQGFSMDPFLNGELDVASAMIYNEYHTVLESGVNPNDIQIIAYEDFGLGFPGDALMTTRELVEQNPDLVARMVRASLRGWQYAIDHPEEAVEIVLKYDKTGLQERDHQLSMMEEISKLVQVSVRPLGFTERSDVRQAIQVLLSYGVIADSIEPEDVFTNEYWEQATGTSGE